ncbi:hypothetical protein BpHYR1_031219 [Brachionus plicatilis]|uniref:Uncharacterized protein n=1 Tax=Brachionus plicatilis TaxID=10195 RepID=A0A3M7Q9T8_BRAPC|nr:hypothetical protein BpHYR1_031219 [Brachionus plicatilis]
MMSQDMKNSTPIYDKQACGGDYIALYRENYRKRNTVFSFKRHLNLKLVSLLRHCATFKVASAINFCKTLQI